MYNTVIAGYLRSPFTIADKGGLIDIKPVNLLAEVIKNLISKTKMGFAIPISEWLQNELYNWAGDYLTEEMCDKHIPKQESTQPIH